MERGGEKSVLDLLELIVELCVDIAIPFVFVLCGKNTIYKLHRYVFF